MENLENLAVAADAVEAVEAPAGAEVEAEAGAQSENVAAEVAALVRMAAGILTPAFPSLAGIYTEEACARLGDAAAPVLAKYGLSVGGLFDRWGAEITLAAVAVPVALATWQGIKADRAPKAEAAGKPAPAAPVEAPAGAGQVPTLIIPAPGAAK